MLEYAVCHLSGDVTTTAIMGGISSLSILRAVAQQHKSSAHFNHLKQVCQHHSNTNTNSPSSCLLRYPPKMSIRLAVIGSGIFVKECHLVRTSLQLFNPSLTPPSSPQSNRRPTSPLKLYTRALSHLRSPWASMSTCTRDDSGAGKDVPRPAPSRGHRWCDHRPSYYQATRVY